MLLSLKADYKKATGVDWTPNTKPAAQIPANTTSPPVSKDNGNGVLEKIAAQGDKIRQLKSEKADKKLVEAEVN